MAVLRGHRKVLAADGAAVSALLVAYHTVPFEKMLASSQLNWKNADDWKCHQLPVGQPGPELIRSSAE